MSTENGLVIPETHEWRRGWRALVASAAGVSVGIPALVNSSGLFIEPMQQEFGWSRSALAVGPIVGFLYSCLNPVAGVVIDRIGARVSALVGLILLSIGLLALAAAPPQAGIFYALLIALGIIGTVTNAVVYCKGVATWFSRHAGTAIALVLSGISIGGALMQPLLAFIIERYGWRAGYIALSATTIVVGVPLVLSWFRERPEYVQKRAHSLDDIPGSSVLEAVRNKRFWLIVAAFGGASLPIGGFVSQLQVILIGKGYAPGSAALFVSAFLVATGAGRLVAGILFDHLKPPLVAACCLWASALGALLIGMVPGEESWLIIAIAVSLIGVSQGAEIDFIALFMLRVFGLRHFSTLFAIIATVTGVSIAAGGFLFAASFDRHGNYEIAVFVSAAVLFVTALFALAIKVPPAPVTTE